MNWLMKAARFANLAAAVGSISRCWRRHVVSHSALDLFRIFFYWFSATSLFLLLHSSSSLSFLVFFFAHPLSRLSHKRRRRRNAINSPCWLNFLLNNEVFVSNEKVINEISSFVTSALADLSTRKRNQSKVKER